MKNELCKSDFPVIGSIKDDGYGNLSLSPGSRNMLAVFSSSEYIKSVAKGVANSKPHIEPLVDVERFPFLLYGFVRGGLERGLSMSISHDKDLPYLINFAAVQLNQSLDSELFDNATYYMDHEGTVRARLKGMTPAKLHNIEPISMGRYLERVREKMGRLDPYSRFQGNWDSSLNRSIYFNLERYGTPHGVNYGIPTAMSKDEVDKLCALFENIGIDLRPEFKKLTKSLLNVVRIDSLMADLLRRDEIYYYPEDNELQVFFQFNRFNASVYDPEKAFAMEEFKSIDDAIARVGEVTKSAEELLESRRRTLEVKVA